MYFEHPKLFREMDCLNWGFPSTRRHPVKGIKGQAHEEQRQCHMWKTQTDAEFTLCCPKWGIKIFDNYSKNMKPHKSQFSVLPSEWKKKVQVHTTHMPAPCPKPSWSLSMAFISLGDTPGDEIITYHPQRRVFPCMSWWPLPGVFSESSGASGFWGVSVSSVLSESFVDRVDKDALDVFGVLLSDSAFCCCNHSSL